MCDMLTSSLKRFLATCAVVMCMGVAYCASTMPQVYSTNLWGKSFATKGFGISAVAPAYHFRTTSHTSYAIYKTLPSGGVKNFVAISRENYSAPAPVLAMMRAGSVPPPPPPNPDPENQLPLNGAVVALLLLAAGYVFLVEQRTRTLDSF